MNVVFRVDASICIGTGHVMRSLTLAKQLKKLMQASILFICRNLDGNLIDYIKTNGFTVYALPGLSNINCSSKEWYKENWHIDARQTVDIINAHAHPTIDLFVVDHYGLDEKWEAVINPYVKKMMVIDDLANRKHKCDILLDQNFHFPFMNRYQHLVPKHCVQLLGPKYVLFREEFFKVKGNIKNRSGEIANILISFGGTDPTEETIKTLEGLKLLRYPVSITVIAGASNKKKKQIEQICQNNPNYRFFSQVSNIAELMNEADLAIGAGGTTTWERCLLALPSIIIITAQNQIGVTEAVSRFGATINLGMYTTVQSIDILKAVEFLIEHPEKVRELSKRAMELVPWKDVITYPVIHEIARVLNGNT